MSSSNIYNLEDKKGGTATRNTKAATYTESEQREKLVGYVSIPKHLWPFVRHGTHVRYTETAERGGAFRCGGFVLKNPFDTKVKGTTTEKRFFRLQNGFQKNSKTYKAWITAYEDTAFLYAKADAIALTLQRDMKVAIKTLNDNMTRLAAYAKKLEKRLTAANL